MFFDRAMLAMGNVCGRFLLLPSSSDAEVKYRYSSYSVSPSSSVYKKRQSSSLGGKSSRGQRRSPAESCSYCYDGHW